MESPILSLSPVPCEGNVSVHVVPVVLIDPELVATVVFFSAPFAVTFLANFLNFSSLSENCFAPQTVFAPPYDLYLLKGVVQ